MRSLENWHQRYTQQAGWTANLRRYLLGKLVSSASSRWLEVGCGTGAVLQDLRGAYQQNINIQGLDIDLKSLIFSRNVLHGLPLICADALAMPFSNASYDVVFCHFLLLWLADPQAVLCEMTRLVRPGGVVIAMAEPDYGSRIDYPPSLDELGRQQTVALRNQGADPMIGRRIGRLLHNAGLQNIQVGVLGGEWLMGTAASGQETEWQVLADDLRAQVTAEQLAYWQQVDQSAWKKNERILYVPTFYGWGHVT